MGSAGHLWSPRTGSHWFWSLPAPREPHTQTRASHTAQYKAAAGILASSACPTPTSVEVNLLWEALGHMTCNTLWRDHSWLGMWEERGKQASDERLGGATKLTNKVQVLCVFNLRALTLLRLKEQPRGLQEG